MNVFLLIFKKLGRLFLPPLGEGRGGAFLP
jgi:hypothetical protein